VQIGVRRRPPLCPPEGSSSLRRRPRKAVFSCIVVQLCNYDDVTTLDPFEAQARLMRALASPIRLKILYLLHAGERCICELQPHFRMNKSTLCRHVAQLRNAGLIGERKDGTRCYLRLITPCVLDVISCVQDAIETESRRRTNGE